MVKYRRLYDTTVKKFVIASGIGVSLIFAYFILMAQRGDITITGYSGDMICAGTVDDPCYAYINFTANLDIYVYPTDEVAWNFYTDKLPKKIIMQRSWGMGWRTIYLNKTWSKRTKYAIKFSKGRSYQLRFIGYKFNPTDTIKWGFSEIDPYWFGTEEKPIRKIGTFILSPSAEEICDKEGCGLNIHEPDKYQHPISKEWIEGDLDDFLKVELDGLTIKITYFNITARLHPFITTKIPKHTISKIELKKVRYGYEFIPVLNNNTGIQEIGFSIDNLPEQIKINIDDLKKEGFDVELTKDRLKIKNPHKTRLDPTLEVTGTTAVCGKDEYTWVVIQAGGTASICEYNGTIGGGEWNVTASKNITVYGAISGNYTGYLGSIGNTFAPP